MTDALIAIDTLPPERVSISISKWTFLWKLVEFAIECGCSSNRVETLVSRLGDAWGYQVDAAALPTAYGSMHMAADNIFWNWFECGRWSINLDRLALLNDLVDQVEHHQMFLDEAVENLKSVCNSPSPYPRWLTYLAGGGSSLAIIYTNGGRGKELIAGMGLGPFMSVKISVFCKRQSTISCGIFIARCMSHLPVQF